MRTLAPLAILVLASVSLVAQPPAPAVVPKQGEVWLFLVPGCPIAQRYAPEVQRLAGTYQPKGFTFKVVFADEAIPPAEAKQHLQEFGYRLPFVVDQGQRLRKQVGATHTPTVAVVLPNGTVAYRGRIDDRYGDIGRGRAEPNRRDLKIALDEILSGRRVSIPRTEVVGCILPP